MKMTVSLMCPRKYFSGAGRLNSAVPRVESLLFSGWLLFVALLPTAAIGAEDGLEQQFNNALSTTAHAPSPLFVRESRSPRQLLQAFSQLVAEIRAVFAKGGRQGDIDGAKEKQLVALYTDLAQLIDTSELPEHERFARTNAALSQLAEVMARVSLPPTDEIPDAIHCNRLNFGFSKLFKLGSL
ncbi:hypothetical protein Thi970DRAFT_02033 [Thiorhodovibrio frisius]|uniref:Uncharacterized protein n=2 Tax=Thiorhodovibrio frisius TaxID=631362 RepID=H8Z392_9GAMM|nr:hypothetical protein Thi970DRAFT_02033 [Thiorhodovibrio frisius]WPL21770.1 hypothetical protein Thiofri_01903 [Thiorhodovibrio frisius]